MNQLVRVYTEEERKRHDEHAEIKPARYIYWAHEAEKVCIDHEEYNRIAEWLATEGRAITSPYKTKRIEWFGPLDYRVDTQTRKYQPAMYVSSWDSIQQKREYTIYYTEMDSEKLEKDAGAGSKGYNTLGGFFRKQWGVSLEQAFGELPVEGGDCYLSKCVKSVKQAIWYDKLFMNKKMKNLYKADIKSAFPYAGTGKLPNAHTAIEMEGRVPPSEEYPFAFYVKSGHVAEYGIFDTHELRQNSWYKKFENSNKQNCQKNNEPFTTFGDIDDEDEITVLMKASRYTLDGAIGKMFWVKENGEEKKTRDWYKWMLNAVIGYMRSEKNNNQHYQGHISAIIYCRVVSRMIEFAEKLMKEKNLPIYFAIDCIIWCGGPSSLISTEKKLGNFMEEAVNVNGVVCGQGQYYLVLDGSTIEKHQGVSKSKYKEYDIKNMDDFIKKMGRLVVEKEVFNPSTNKFEYKEVFK